MAILHEDPYRLTEVAGVGFARADKIALAADVPPESRAARPGGGGLRARGGRAAGPHLPAAGRAQPPHREADRPAARPRRAGPGAGLLLDEGRAYREPTHASELAVAATLAARARRPAPPRPRPRRARRRRTTRTRRELTDEQWAAVRGAFAARISVLTGGPGVGKTACTQGDRRRGRRAGARSRSARRPGAPPAGWRRRPATRRRRSTGCWSGCQGASRASGPVTRCPSTWRSSTRPRC